MVKTIFAAVIGLLLALGLSAPAVALEYNVTDPDARVSAGTIAPGGTVTFTAEGFAPGTDVTVSVSNNGAATRVLEADSAGVVSTQFQFANAGRFTITATGVDAAGGPVSVNATVTVAAAAGSGSGGAAGGGGSSLAQTGADNVATIAWVAFGVVILGGALVAVATGRRQVRETV